MKKQKVLALVLSLVMVVSMLAACGNTEQKGSTGGVSLDFEDSKSAFALVKTAPRKADESSLSVKDVNGSKVLYVTNEKGGSEMYLALDLDGLLGANVSKLAKIEMTIGADRTDSDKFTAISGKSYVYAGATAAELKETRLGDWAVYTSSKNPNTVTFDLSGVTMTAGADTYFLLNKDTDAGSTPANFYIDNVKFLDKDGKLIECNKNVVMEPVGDKFIKVPEKPDVSAGVVHKDEQKPDGEWVQDCVVPSSIFDGMDGAVEMTIKYELIPGDAGYLCWGLLINDGGWKKLTKEVMTPEEAFVEGIEYDNKDGLFAIDREATELKVVLSAEAVAALKKAPEGNFFGMSYHVDVYEIIVKPATSAAKTNSYKDSVVPGEWGKDCGDDSTDVKVIPAGFFNGMEGSSVELTVKYDILEGGDGYWLWVLCDPSWAKLGGLTNEAAFGSEASKVNDQGYFMIDSTVNEFTITLTPELVAKLNAEGFFGQSYHVDVFEVVAKQVVAPAAKTNSYKDSVVPGEWGKDCGDDSTDVKVIPAGFFNGMEGSSVELTVKYDILEGGDGYWLWVLCDPSWAKLGGLTNEAAFGSEASKVNDQGYFVIDSAVNEFTITLTPELVAKLNAEGFFGQSYHVDVFEVVAKQVVKDTVSNKYKDEVVPGEWGKDCGDDSTDVKVVPAGFFNGMEGSSVELTIKYDILEGGDGYWLWVLCDPSWAKLGGLTNEAAFGSEASKVNDQGYFVIDSAVNEFTITLTPELVAKLNAEGFFGQSYHVDVYEITAKTK